METIALDVFKRTEFEQFVPTDVLTQRSNMTNNLLLLGGIVVVAVIYFVIIKDDKNKNYEERKITHKGT